MKNIEKETPVEMKECQEQEAKHRQENIEKEIAESQREKICKGRKLTIKG
jgi:hypothetical protein